MNLRNFCIFIFLVVLFCSCAAGKNYNPAKKYSVPVLQQEYTLLRNILEAKHPSLYWYTDKEKMTGYFNKFYADIKDSMTEQRFAWHILAPLIQKIRCGHTSVSMSKAYGKWVKGKPIPAFPLYMKIWNDTMAVTANLNYKKDSIFKRGTLVTSVNGIPNKLLIKYMMEFLPVDGYAENVNYVRLSANFPYFHRNVFGLSKTYTITYKDTAGAEQKTIVPLFIPARDSLRKDSIIRKEKKRIAPEKRLLQHRSFVIDSTKTFATMTVNTFAEGHLRSFFRRSFRELKKENISNLILDLRSNGGGRVGLSTLLTKHISRKKTDGKYHMSRFEKHYYSPKRNNYTGKIYVLINGPTFSASTVFANAIKGQDGITLIGEETGGGWYGNNGIMIPDIKLPGTGVRVRLPLFRLVQYNHNEVPVKGTGIIPDIYVGTSYDALLKGYDKKMRVVKELIKNNLPRQVGP